MPFDHSSPALTNDAYKVVIDFVDSTFSSEKKESFYQNSGKTRDAWLHMKRGSHGEYLSLIHSFYEQMGEHNPELLYPIYSTIGLATNSPVRTLAKVLGSAPAVVEASAYLSAMLNDDSRIKVHNLHSSGASIQQTVEGPTDLFYPEQIFGGMGYYKGIAPLFRLDVIQAELKMLSIPLDQFLRMYNKDFSWEKDEQGNFYTQGNLFAKALAYQQSDLAFLGIPSPLWRTQDGYYIGALQQAGSGQKVRLEELLVTEITQDLSAEGLPFIREGMIFGGHTPAPTNLYTLQWEAKKGLRQNIWLFFSDLRTRAFESKEAVAHAALLADAEAQRRSKAETSVVELKEELSKRTADAYEQLQEDAEARGLFRLELHDVAHKINVVGLKTFSEFLEWFEDFSQNIFRQDSSLLPNLNETLASYEQPSYEILYKTLMQDPDKKGPLVIATLGYSLLEILQNKGYIYESQSLEREMKRVDRIKEDCENLEKDVRAVMLMEKGKTVVDIPYHALWARTVEKFAILGKTVRKDIQIPEEIIFHTHQTRFQLLIENLALNSLEAAAENVGGYLHIFAEEQRESISTSIENSAAWKNPEQVDMVIQKMRAPGAGFSTKGDAARSAQRGSGQSLIVETLRMLNATYIVEGDYSSRHLRQTILFPREMIKNN
ncbi:hypothetical protein J4424_04280 [Candidatus Woesearchaeota archaeon]|nr:hypothetical protein [uncultured archaeon]MBS3154497.1 hypothetical protein [Candidatus Woesearchaeota archaeon]